MDLRLKVMTFLVLVLLLAVLSIYFLTGDVFEPWFVVVLIFLFAVFFVVRITQNRAPLSAGSTNQRVREEIGTYPRAC